MATGHFLIFIGQHADAGLAAEKALGDFGQWDRDHGRPNLSIDQIDTNLVIRYSDEDGPEFVYMITVVLVERT